LRLLELHLKAFGPFTGRNLDLSGGEPGLHVLFGPNEAGKSSALRALKVLLFGFPQRSSDDFLHPYDQLRVGGRLRLADGSEVSFVRRKGLKNTLLSAEDESPLDAGFLDRCLRGMEERHFSNLFGIDHEALIEGGRELLEQGGEVGQALFSASLGSRSLRQVLDSLEAESRDLFAKNASKPLINQAVAEYKAAKRELAEASLSGRELEGDRKELERRRELAETLRVQTDERERERNRLQRLRRALPLLAERRLLSARRAELAGVSLLAPDFSERRRETQEALRKAREDRSRADAELATTLEEASSLVVASPLLAQAETIERLHQHVGRFKKDISDRQRLEVESRELHARAVEQLEEVRPDWTLEEAEALRPTNDRLRRIQDLGNQRQALVGAVDQARRITREAEGALAGTAEDEQLRLGILRLGLWSDTADELEALPVPPTETLERFGRDLAALADRRRVLEERRQAAQGAAGEAARQLEVLRRAGAVPTEDDLAEARKRREEGWRLVKRHDAGKDVSVEARLYDPERALFNAYERAVHQADEIADRLRREADRVQLQARLSTDRDQRAAEAEALDAQLADLTEETGRAEAAWKDLWRPCGIEPLPPREMHPGWTARFERLRDRAEAVRETRRRAESRLDTARRDEEAALEALEAWSGAWAEAIRGLGLGGEALPSEVSQLVDSLRRSAEALREAEKTDRRIAGLDRDLETFGGDIRALAAELAPDRLSQPPDQTAVHLQGLLQEARRKSERRMDLEKRIAKLESQARDAEVTRQAMEERLAELRREAGCDDDAGLEEAERKSAEARDLQRDLDRCERQLLEAGEGAALGDLEREAGSVDADELPGRIEQLGREVEELERQLGDLREELGRRGRELEQRMGGDAAARAAERAEEALARTRDGVERYVRLRLAGTLLRRRIERYRAQNQAPLLRRAGELFTTLTLGSFAGLQTDFDDRDEPVLVGVRAEGRPVRVEGMSDGTRDQLYLALRLATLEKYLAHGEPLPFVVDDILINFDDRRSEATLKVLAELSKSTQVILFTHHERLRDMAGALRNGTGVFVRELGV
jgi:uncharacterized protein YhaN